MDCSKVFDRVPHASLLHKLQPYGSEGKILFAKQWLIQLPGDIATYRNTRNLCRSEIRAHQKRHQSWVLKVTRQNKSYLFKYMRRFKKNKPSAFLLKLNEIPTADAESVAKGFRDHLLSVQAETFNATHPALPSRHYGTALWQVPLHIAEVGKLLERINPYSVIGPDDIHPRILKEAADILALPLFSLFTDSLLTGVLPAAWKQANVTPIYKSASYCPINLTSIPCKILERLSKKLILNHLQGNNLISDMQHGFLPERSCYTNLLPFTDSLTQARYDSLI